MKKLVNVVAYTLALNFLASLAGLGWLYRTGHLDRGRVTAVRAVLFPPATQPAVRSEGASPATQPAPQLDDLVKKMAGRSAEEQVEFLQRTFDARLAQLDRRQREVSDQQRQVDFGLRRLADDRAALEQEKKQLADTEQQAAKLAGDQGFQDSLQLYSAMLPNKVKAIFASLKDETVVQYLEAMPPRTAARIVKEFKTPEETDRIQRVLERMRQPPVTEPPPGQSAAADRSPSVR